MAFRFEHLESFPANARPLFAERGSCGHSERLLGNRIAILLAGVSHIAHRNAAEPRKLRGYPHGIRAALADAQEHVIALAVRFESQPFADFKILGQYTHARAADGRSVSARHA